MFSLLLDHEEDSQYKNEGSNVDVSFQNEQENKLDEKPPSSLQDKAIIDEIVKVLQDRKSRAVFTTVLWFFTESCGILC